MHQFKPFGFSACMQNNKGEHAGTEALLRWKAVGCFSEKGNSITICPSNFISGCIPKRLHNNIIIKMGTQPHTHTNIHSKITRQEAVTHPSMDAT